MPTNAIIIWKEGYSDIKSSVWAENPADEFLEM